MEPSRISSVLPSMFYIPNFITQEEEAHILSKIPPNRWISLSRRRLQTLPAKLTATNTLLTSSPLPTWLSDPIVPRIHSLIDNNNNNNNENGSIPLFSNAPHGINHCLINEYTPGQGILPHEDGAAYHPVVATVSLSGTLVLDVVEKQTRMQTQTQKNNDERIGTGTAIGGAGGSGGAGGGDDDDDDDDDEDEKNKRKAWRIVQEPRSLLITTGDAYTETLHGIAEVTEDVELNAETVANWELLSETGREVIATSGGKNARTTRISLTYRDVKKVSTIGSKMFGKARR